ncbi:PilZ domain-containing protein [Paucidesulfovibrio gracilis DSM 16080]|uniref:PilZ domain-containing protein n=1 Tax=Paucidesulfovibrio gracilis DSM 16080 TaxID=1121449 RepID=A0A1T4WJI7_9BACT|nr:PilZ domain-containing protein [Paucidesulfovibrio gracilis]SKA77349.1 PilZ domain-containing protein [Paucidesulfovibrio gracilis DSM 16080]
MENLNVTIALPPKLAYALSELAESQNITFSTLVRTVLEQHLRQEEEVEIKKQAAQEQNDQEKRKYARKQVAVPTAIRFKTGGSIDEGQIEMVNISLGGALLSLPASHPLLKEMVNHPETFDLVITLPEEKNPVSFTSKASRVKKNRDKVQIGVSFDEYSYYDFIKLYNFLG